MRGYAAFIHRHATAILLVVVAVSAVMGLRLPLDYDDDVVEFLPQADPEVERFNRITDRFGSLNVALVGIESSDLYTKDRLEYVRRVTEKLDGLGVVRHVTSLTELSVIQGKDEAEHKPLVPREVPSAPSALADMKSDILSLDYIAGSVASEDGTSTQLIVQIADTIDDEPVNTTRAATAVREAVQSVERPEGVTLHFGGAPFIAEAAANGSQRDLARLAPYVIGIILALILFSLGSLRAALLTVTCVGLGILWTMGLMGWMGQSLTLVSTSLPVVLVALGSAYAVHLLVWYLEHGADVSDMLEHIGWPVIVTALTTMAGFISFLAMDLAPMRAFGWQMAMGTAVCAGVALLIIPAALSKWPIPAREAAGEAERRFDRVLMKIARGMRRSKWLVIGATAAVAVGCVTQLQNIRTDMDTSAFFAEDSDPARADRFMANQFGGSVFIQVLVDGDVHDPATLHRIAAFEDRLAAIDGVHRIESISKVLAVVHEGLKTTRRLPDKRDEAELYGYLAARTDPAVGLLVDEKWSGALIQVGIGGFNTAKVQPLTEKIRALAAEHVDGREAVRIRRDAEHEQAVLRDAAERIAALTGGDRKAVRKLEGALDAKAGVDRAKLVRAVGGVLESEIVEDEMVLLKSEDAVGPLTEKVTDGLLGLTLTAEGFVKLLEPIVDDAERKDPKAFHKAARYVFTQVEKKARPMVTGKVRAAVAKIVGKQRPAVKLRVAAIVDDVMAPFWYVSVPAGSAGAPTAAATPPMAATVSGQPVIQDAMTRSVQRNQKLSLLVSVPLVLLIMIVVFRSIVAGLLGTIPTALTLLVIFGVMGMFPDALPMDIASSMLASIALGVGIDYAIHYMWRWREGGLRAAVHTTGRAILINAAEITGGFVVLAWATIVPMSRFGLLTGATLLVAAAATLLLLPTLLDWWKPAGEVETRGESWEAKTSELRA